MKMAAICIRSKTAAAYSRPLPFHDRGFCLEAGAQDRPAEYQLGAGDIVRVTVFQNPDLTVETRVTENGTISYPLVGSVKVGGMTIPAAEQAIATALKNGGFLREPQVNIATAAKSRQPGIRARPGQPSWALSAGNDQYTRIRDARNCRWRNGDRRRCCHSNRYSQRQTLSQRDRHRRRISEQSTSGRRDGRGGRRYLRERQPVYYIYGEVQRPGSYRVERSMTVRTGPGSGRRAHRARDGAVAAPSSSRSRRYGEGPQTRAAGSCPARRHFVRARESLLTLSRSAGRRAAPLFR